MDKELNKFKVDIDFKLRKGDINLHTKKTHLHKGGI